MKKKDKYKRNIYGEFCEVPQCRSCKQDIKNEGYAYANYDHLGRITDLICKNCFETKKEVKNAINN